MALTPLPFEGATFFSSIRLQMNNNRGLFSGVDGAFRYVCMDANFYRLFLLVRPISITFTDAAAAAPASGRVIANGQVFNSYCVFSPCDVQWQGRIVSDGVLVPGGGSAAAFRHVGQWGGCSELSFAVASGDPNSVTPSYSSAFGRLLPLVQKRVPTPAGPLGTFWTKPPKTGKIVYGLARSAQVVFILAQQDGELGLIVSDLIARLMSMNVDDAVMGDGSDSATLIVDHSVEVTPGRIKNVSIPVGPMFRIHSFQLSGTRTMINSSATNDPQLQIGITVTNTAGKLSLTNSGMELTITSLGNSTGITTATLINLLEVTFPLTLTATTSLITHPATLRGPKVTATLTLIPSATLDGHLTGTLTFTTSRGIAQFDVDWQVGHVP